MAIVVCVISSFNIFSIYFSILIPNSETCSAEGSRDNNEHMAFLDIGCECGGMKYAFFYTMKN